jgi:GNAT superfamily N-acetyltransferase
MEGIRIRNAEPSDYQPIISVINEWWGGRSMADMLPKLFFVHFRQTSFVVEHGEDIVGFLIGFASQTFPDEAYIHFVGVHPGFRKKGLGEALYGRFFEKAKAFGCSRVRCVTSPVNRGSVTFHLRMGFSMEPSEKTVDGISVVEDYDGRGEHRVLFSKTLCNRGK